MVRPPAAETLRRRGDDGLNEGLALSLSSAIGSVAGLLSWIVATRLVAPMEVGRAAPVAVGYIAVQVICATAVLLAPARRRPTDVEVVSP
jgi:hypothetical protein